MQAVRLLIVAVLVAACAGVPLPVDPGDGTEGGPGLPVQRPDRPIAGPRAAISGQVAVQGNGCLHVAFDDGRFLFAIWPAGTAMDGSGDAMLVGDRAYRDGDPFRGIGAVVPVAALPDPTYWREAHLLFCDPEASEVVVLDAMD